MDKKENTGGRLEGRGGEERGMGKLQVAMKSRVEITIFFTHSCKRSINNKPRSD